MKKWYLLVSLLGLLNSTTTFSQIQKIDQSSRIKWIEIGKVGGGATSAFIASLSYYREDDTTNTYALVYNNLKYTHITDLKTVIFKATPAELTGLYESMSQQMKAEKGAQSKFVLGKDEVTLATVRNLGVSSLLVYVLQNSVSSYFQITQKQLDKLFGFKPKEE